MTEAGKLYVKSFITFLLQQLQSVMNSATTRVLFVEVQSHHSAPPPTALSDSSRRIQFKLAVLVYKCLHRTALSYLADKLEYTADFEARRRHVLRTLSHCC